MFFLLFFLACICKTVSSYFNDGEFHKGLSQTSFFFFLSHLHLVNTISKFARYARYFTEFIVPHTEKGEWHAVPPLLFSALKY